MRGGGGGSRAHGRHRWRLERASCAERVQLRQVPTRWLSLPSVPRAIGSLSMLRQRCASLQPAPSCGGLCGALGRAAGPWGRALHPMIGGRRARCRLQAAESAQGRPPPPLCRRYRHRRHRSGRRGASAESQQGWVTQQERGGMKGQLQSRRATASDQNWWARPGVSPAGPHQQRGGAAPRPPLSSQRQWEQRHKRMQGPHLHGYSMWPKLSCRRSGASCAAERRGKMRCMVGRVAGPADAKPCVQGHVGGGRFAGSGRWTAGGALPGERASRQCHPWVNLHCRQRRVAAAPHLPRALGAALQRRGQAVRALRQGVVQVVVLQGGAVGCAAAW